jgi:hypothetical protein
MKRSPAARTTYSYAQISYVLGTSLTTTRFDSARVAKPRTLRWQCGCSAAGPFRSMVWDACESHTHYTVILNEVRSATQLPTWNGSAGIRFSDHTATWSFDPSNPYCEKQFRAEYLSILHACGTAAGDFFAAELIYRELISNAFRHAPGKVDVELQWSEPYPVLSVHDRSDLFSWTGELPSNPLNERGRGLYLVNFLARELRIKGSVGEGYKISAVLPLERKRDLPNLFDFPTP